MNHATLLVLDANLRAVLASHSFYQRFAARPEEIAGRHLHEVMERTWDFPALRRLVAETLAGRSAGEVFELERDFPGVAGAWSESPPSGWCKTRCVMRP